MLKCVKTQWMQRKEIEISTTHPHRLSQACCSWSLFWQLCWWRVIETTIWLCSWANWWSSIPGRVLWCLSRCGTPLCAGTVRTSEEGEKWVRSTSWFAHLDCHWATVMVHSTVLWLETHSHVTKNGIGQNLQHIGRVTQHFGLKKYPLKQLSLYAYRQNNQDTMNIGRGFCVRALESEHHVQL